MRTTHTTQHDVIYMAVTEKGNTTDDETRLKNTIDE